MKKMEKLREKATRKGLNIGDDALFIVGELSGELRWVGSVIIALQGITIGLIAGFAIAALT